MNNDTIKKITATLTRTDFPHGVPAKEDGLIHRSGRSGVIAKVHATCDKLITEKGKTRKDVLARCAKLGIAHHTAATQYDRWRSPPKKKEAK